MSYFAKISLGPPLDRAALQAVPDMVLQIEEIRSLPDEPWRLIFWAYGDDFEAYESGLAADPMVSTFTCLTKLPDRRLYRTIQTEEAQRKTVHPTVVEEDITLLDLTVTADSVEFLGRFPSREAVSALRDAAREKDRDFQLLNLYEEKPPNDDNGQSNRYGVTKAQREALLNALEKGYFSVPRQTTMEDIADGLGVSTSALSTRLRRGQQALLRNTLTGGSAI